MHFLSSRSARRINFYVSAFSLVTALCLSSAGAQNLTGQLDGTVRDVTGSLVPNASITITNTDRNEVVRKLQTNGEGVFSAPQLEVGHYSVAVTSPGFKQTIINAEVHEGQSTSLAFALQTGAVQEVVTVTADPLTPQLDNAAASTLLSGTQVRELSLSNRNFEQLLFLQPGISGPPPGPLDRGNFQPSGATNTASFSVNGQGTTQNGYFLDGQDMINHGGNAQVIVFPSIESLQEISLLRNTYGAQYGGSGGAVFSNISKGGTTSFHGGLYDFERSQIFNANSYFNNYGGIARPPLRYHDFGYFLGGPLWFPGGHRTKENSKLFFFAGQQFLREDTATSESITNLPTLAQRVGTFTHPVCRTYNAAGTCTATTTQIPVTSFDPTAAAYLKDLIDKVSAPNSPTDVQGILFSAPGTNNESQVFTRIDYQATKKLSTFFRYVHDPFNLTVPNGFQSAKGFPGAGTSTVVTDTSAYLGHGEYTLSDKTVLEGGYGFIVNDVLVNVIGNLAATNSPDVRPILPYVSTLNRIPSLTINGGTAWSATGPNMQHQHTNQVFLNVTHTAGKQTLYYGGSLEIYLYDKTTGTTNAGAFAFTANSLAYSTGSAACKANAANCTTQFEQAFAQFLLGQVSTFTQSSSNPANSSHNSLFEGYVQDDYRPTPRLTLNAGLRYFFKLQPRLGAFNNLPKLTFSNFDQYTYNSAAAPTIDSNGNICMTAPCAGGKAPNLNANVNNGLIFAGINSPYGQTILSQNTLNFAPRVGFAYDYTGHGTGSIRGGYGIYHVQLANSIFQQISIGNPPNATTIGISNTSFGNPGTGVPTGTNTPPSLSTIDPRSMTPYIQDFDLDVQKQLPRGILVDVGYFGNHQVHQLGQIDLNQPLPGAYVGNTSIAAGGVTAAKSTILNLVRPYQGWGNIGETASIFTGIYNGLQASLTKHFAGRSLVAVNYTYSKGLANSQGDSASPQDIYNLTAEYGPSAFDRRHIFSADFVYEEPFFRNSEAVMRELLAGWEATGIVSAGSGLYSTATNSAQDPSGIGLLASGSTSSARPDQLSNPNGGPKTVSQWFKTGAFANVPNGQVRAGDAPVNSILGPGYVNLDLSVFKNFDIFRELNTQLRIEGFNVFNHTNFTTINTTVGNTAYGSATAAASNRILQIGAKFNF
jgi:hypothetical protein